MKQSLTVKVIADSKQEIDEVVKALESRFLVVATSEFLESRDGGFHIFLNLISKQIAEETYQ